MRTFAAALLIAFLTSSALALGPSIYVGGNLQINSPTGDFRKTDIMHEQGGAKTGLGGEVDVGLTGSGGSLYLGHRFGKLDAEASMNQPGGTQRVDASGSWNIARWVVGGRWHIFGSSASPVVPTLGAGITIGKTKADASTGGAAKISASEISKSDVGWFVEGGVLIRGGGKLSVIGDLQYHQFKAAYNTDLWNGTVKVSFFTFQVGLRYAIL